MQSVRAFTIPAGWGLTSHTKQDGNKHKGSSQAPLGTNLRQLGHFEYD